MSLLRPIWEEELLERNSRIKLVIFDCYAPSSIYNELTFCKASLSESCRDLMIMSLGSLALLLSGLFLTNVFFGSVAKLDEFF